MALGLLNPGTCIKTKLRTNIPSSLRSRSSHTAPVRGRGVCASAKWSSDKSPLDHAKRAAAAVALTAALAMPAVAEVTMESNPMLTLDSIDRPSASVAPPASVEKPVAAASVEKPVAAASVEKLVKKLVVAAPSVEKPVAAASVVVAAPSVEKPVVAPTSVEKPVAAPSVGSEPRAPEEAEGDEMDRLEKRDSLIPAIASGTGAVGLIVGYVAGSSLLTSSSSSSATLRTDVSKGGVTPVPGDSDAMKAMRAMERELLKLKAENEAALEDIEVQKKLAVAAVQKEKEEMLKFLQETNDLVESVGTQQKTQ